MNAVLKCPKHPNAHGTRTLGLSRCRVKLGPLATGFIAVAILSLLVMAAASSTVGGGFVQDSYCPEGSVAPVQCPANTGVPPGSDSLVSCKVRHLAWPL